MIKNCNGCKLDKDTELFANRKRSKDGKNPRCKECTRKQNKYSYYENWETNRERIDKYHYERIKQLRLEVDRYKTERGCNYCGYNFHPVCLDFHHLNPNEKVLTISNMINRKVKASTLWAEIAKCIIVCSNCHRLLHNNIIGDDKTPPLSML